MQTPKIQDLINAGVHVGHLKQNSNPKAKAIVSTRVQNVDVIDLEKTISYLEKAQNFLKEIVEKEGNVLFIGAKRQAKKIVEKHAREVGMPFVVNRWMGGTFTNFSVMRKRANYFERKESRYKSNAFSNLPKKSIIQIEKELEKLRTKFDGLKKLRKLPQAIIIVDPYLEEIAFKEAKQMNIPIVAITDTNFDFTKVEYPVPANDDMMQPIKIIMKYLTDGIKEGLKLQAQKGSAISKDSK